MAKSYVTVDRAPKYKPNYSAVANMYALQHNPAATTRRYTAQSNPQAPDYNRVNYLNNLIHPVLEGPYTTQPALDAQNQAAQTASGSGPMGSMYGGNGGGGGRGGGRGGGGGKAGPSAAQVKNIANSLFAFNRAPWLNQYASNDQMQKQLAAYNPDFAAMGRQYQGLLGQENQQYQSDTAARIAQLAQLRNTLGATQTTQMQGTMRDLAAQGFNPSAFAGQANAANADMTAQLGNQGAFMTNLGQVQAGANQDALRLSGLITQGGQAELANNRLQTQNQLAAARNQIALQQAQAEQANEQAKREFMLKYGVF